jgi:hypothetical protein
MQLLQLQQAQRSSHTEVSIAETKPRNVTCPFKEAPAAAVQSNLLGCRAVFRQNSFQPVAALTGFEASAASRYMKAKVAHPVCSHNCSKYQYIQAVGVLLIGWPPWLQHPPTGRLPSTVVQFYVS